MANLDRNISAFSRAMSPSETAAIDAGLRAYMLRVYNYMLIGVAITGVAALAVYLLSVTDDLAHASYVLRAGRVIPVPAGLAVQSSDVLLTGVGYMVFVSPLKWLIIFAPLALVLGLSFNAAAMRPAVAQALFWLYAALVGVSLGSVFLIYTHTSIARVFFIAAAAFGGLSLWGYTTRRDLGALGAFAAMGLIGIILAGLVNLFLGSSSVQWLVSVVGVLVFSGLTAWDTQRLKGEYLYGAMDGEIAERSAILGALSLYLDFVNLFTLLLEGMGQRDE
ncbi:MAG TPA: Bax inhibitor-1/YccA family protein [Xanthobacteraceae bacterium]|nr:Bax inhibitor-1/YccA family protein [Xanthobacteraceae bacterium]